MRGKLILKNLRKSSITDMLAKRIIPCLDIKGGRTVKGVNFEQLRDAGDPVELARIYADDGADELVFLDISATIEGRKTLYDLVRRVGEEVNIPYAVGGGISSVDQVYTLLRCGAEKISINSSAIRNPALVTEIANEYGAQCVIVAIDAQQKDGRWVVHTHGGTKATELELYEWARRAQDLGAGEILFTSMDHDGTKNGFAIKALKRMNQEVSIPVIASGGAGSKAHFKEVFELANADAALAASVFHFKEIPVPELKQYLKDQLIQIR